MYSKSEKAQYDESACWENVVCNFVCVRPLILGELFHSVLPLIIGSVPIIITSIFSIIYH